MTVAHPVSRNIVVMKTRSHGWSVGFVCVYVCAAHSLLVGPRPPTFHFNGCCLCCITHTHTSLRSRRRHTHVPNSHSCALSPSLELPSLWWRHFDSLPLLFLCNQFIFAGRIQCRCSMAGNRDREEERQWSWLILHTTYYAGSVWAPDLSHGGLRGGESAFRTCQWVSDSV